MQLSPNNVAFFFTGLQTDFWKSYKTAAPWKSEVATDVMSSTDQEGYGWIGMLDKMREWKGDRIVETPAPQTYLVRNKPFQMTKGIDKFHLKDDKYGIYLPVPSMMGLAVAKWPDYELRDLIENTTGGSWGGAAQYGTDGVAHWSGSHPIDVYDSSKGTYTNDLGSGGTSINGVTVGGALSPTAYATARQEFMSRKAENGEKLGLIPSLLMCGAYLDTVARTILEAQFFSPQSYTGMPGTNVGNVENVLRNTSKLLTNVDLSSAAAWYLFDTTRPMKPFLWQLREAPLWVQRIREDDPVVFNTHQYVFGVESRGAPAWNLPWLSMRSGV